MATATRLCRYCKARKRREEMLLVPVGAFCSTEHALAWSRENRLRAQAKAAQERRKEGRKQHKEAKEKVKKRTAWVADAQRLLNQIVVLEDGPKGCISCNEGKPVTDCGHYFHRGNKYRVSPLTLLRLNLNGQCELCNRWEGGKQHDYMEGFIARYGEAKFLELVEFRRKVDCGEIKPLTIEECKARIVEYRERLKQLKRERA